MRINGWRAKAARKYKATTNSNHSLPVAPNQKWVSDITTIGTEQGCLYLAVVLELYSRRVMGWAIAERMTASLVCDALVMALWRYGVSACRKPSLFILIEAASIAQPPTKGFSTSTH